MEEFIICPNCGSMELAEIKETIPWPTYVHDCSKCDYIIMESEWSQAKAISVRQPWAYLIASGAKDIENRTWRTKFRGRVLIHSGALNDHYWLKKVKAIPGAWSKLGNNSDNYRNSAIIGSVEIIDCIQNSSSIWAEPGCWHWVLKDPVMFVKPILNVKGKLSFFIPQIPEK